MKKYLLALILISILTHFRWLSFNIFFSGDWSYYNPISLRDIGLHFSTTTASSLGGVDLLVWRAPVDFLKTLFGFYGLGSNYSEKFIIFWPTLLLANITSFLLIKKITKSNPASFIGSLVFNYNIYYLVTSTAFLLYSASAWSILSLLFLINGLERKKIFYNILSGLALFISGSFDFRIAYITFFILFFYFIFYILFIERNNITKKIRSLTLKFVVSPLLVFLFLNLYWVMDFLALKSLSSNAVTGRDLFGNEFLNLLYSFTLYHPFWNGEKSVAFVNQEIIPFFWLITIIAFLSLWLNKRNKNVLFFGILVLVGIFLTKQVAPPFGFFYDFLFKYFPGFNAFREASKFYFLIALGYSVLIGSFVAFINTTRISRWVKNIIFLILILIFLINARSLITGTINSIFVSKNMPIAYEKLNEFLNKQEYARILWIPYSSDWGVFSNMSPKIDLIKIMRKEWLEYYDMDELKNLTQGELTIFFLSNKFTDNLFDMSSIRYVIVPLEDETEPNIFIYGVQDRSYYVNNLNKLNYLQKLDLKIKGIDVYENYNYRPHIYITKDIERIDSRQDYEKTNYEFINPSWYKVEIRNLKEPVFINFSEAYHSEWKMYLGLFQWQDVIFNEKKPIDEKNHYKNGVGLNSFHIDPMELCVKENIRRNICIKNKDGSFNIIINLYFKPQSYLNLGLIVSGTVLFILVVYLLCYCGIYFYGKNKK